MACSKLEAMAIYVVKQACHNNIMACVYTVDMVLIIGQPIYVNCFHSLYFVLLGTISYHEILKGLRLSFATIMIAFGLKPVHVLLFRFYPYKLRIKSR